MVMRQLYRRNIDWTGLPPVSGARVSTQRWLRIVKQKAPISRGFLYLTGRCRIVVWRRDRDSNPRNRKRFNRFRVCRLRPLGHLSSVRALLLKPARMSSIGTVPCGNMMIPGNPGQRRAQYESRETRACCYGLSRASLTLADSSLGATGLDRSLRPALRMEPMSMLSSV